MLFEDTKEMITGLLKVMSNVEGMDIWKAKMMINETIESALTQLIRNKYVWVSCDVLVEDGDKFSQMMDRARYTKNFNIKHIETAYGSKQVLIFFEDKKDLSRFIKNKDNITYGTEKLIDTSSINIYNN